MFLVNTLYLIADVIGSFSVLLGLSYKVCVIVIANHNVICVAQKWTLNQIVCENLSLIWKKMKKMKKKKMMIILSSTS